MKHLWEVDHAYCANRGNYFNNDCHQHHYDWASFFAEEGDADVDMNLVYRWDWKVDEEDGSHCLDIYFIGQRKALARSVSVDVTEADEPAVIEYLKPRLAALVALWEPLV